ncbi:amino acid kinase, partial [Candidatus Bathyarchaeota archaeon]|nr:amino acid kinase [Candidatus Bathyarchaeota archaeon]
FDKSQIMGVAKTHQAMVALNSLLIESLLSYSVPAISVAPSSFIVTDGGRITDMSLENLRHYLEKGITPVSYGDVVPDRSRGFSILSGDQLAARFAVEFGADRVIYGVDVDGVYTSNPKLDSDARLVELLSLKDIEENIRLGGSLSTDVTGGMKGKILEAVNALRVGIQVQIVNASKPDIIFKALRGEKVTGTMLVK